MTPEARDVVVKLNRSSKSLVTLGLVLLALAVPTGLGGGQWLRARVQTFEQTFRQEQEQRIQITPATDMERVLVEWLDGKDDRYLHLLRQTWPWILMLPMGLLCSLGATLVCAGFGLRMRFRAELAALARDCS